MNVVGTKWKYIGMDIALDIDGKKGFHSIDEMMAEEKDGPNDWGMMRNTILYFNENGQMQSLMLIPEGTSEEEIEAAKADGMEVIGDRLCIESKDYNQDADGKLTYASGAENTTTVQEDIDAMNTITFDEEGHLRIFAIFGYSVYEQV